MVKLRKVLTKLNKPLIPNIILGSIYNMEQVEKKLKRRFPRPILGPKLGHLYIIPRTRLKLIRGNIQVPQHLHFKFRHRKTTGSPLYCASFSPYLPEIQNNQRDTWPWCCPRLHSLECLKYRGSPLSIHPPNYIWQCQLDPYTYNPFMFIDLKVLEGFKPTNSIWSGPTL